MKGVHGAAFQGHTRVCWPHLFSLLHSRIDVCSVVSDPTRCKPTKLLCPWGCPSRNTGVGSHSLLQGIFPTQGSNPRLLWLLRWQVDSSPVSHQGSPHSSSQQFLSFFSSLAVLRRPRRLSCRLPVGWHCLLSPGDGPRVLSHCPISGPQHRVTLSPGDAVPHCLAEMGCPTLFE